MVYILVVLVSSKVGFDENVCYFPWAWMFEEISNASLIRLIPKMVVALDIKDF